jgi:hypothetical protein
MEFVTILIPISSHYNALFKLKGGGRHNTTYNETLWECLKSFLCKPIRNNVKQQELNC